MTADPHSAAIAMRDRLIAEFEREAKVRRALAAEHEAAGRHEHASLHRFAAGEIEAVAARLAVLEPEGARELDAPPPCPPGWRLVPETATDEMLAAAYAEGENYHPAISVRHRRLYRALITAAPEPPSGWLPIETAPRGDGDGPGPDIDLGGPGWAKPGWWYVAQWIVGFNDHDQPIGPPTDPTHWRPRPQPPLPAPSEESPHAD